MSYILEALRRAERERHATVAEQPAADARPPQRGPRPTTMALAGATLFLAGIGAALMLLRPSAPTPAPVEPATVEVTPTMAPVPTPAAAAPAAPRLSDAAALAGYESLDDVSPVFQGSPPAAPAPGRPSVAPADAPQPTPDRPGGNAVGQKPQTTATPAADVARTLPPRLAEMPEGFQSRFPSPLIQVHVFDADPARRWIMVDNRRHAEGAVLDNGLRIAEILGDGVIFVFDERLVYWPLNR